MRAKHPLLKYGLENRNYILPIMGRPEISHPLITFSSRPFPFPRHSSPYHSSFSLFSPGLVLYWFIANSNVRCMIPPCTLTWASHSVPQTIRTVEGRSVASPITSPDQTLLCRRLVTIRWKDSEYFTRLYTVIRLCICCSSLHSHG